jgi:hypothetical protein
MFGALEFIGSGFFVLGSFVYVAVGWVYVDVDDLWELDLRGSEGVCSER